eukprot:NODE_12425_length_383_cov_34.526946_g11277_i0.p2 GENE.NODE_12425_length_383_cov_34.526946_g11277_i0~~NODE_12425_length_383_cov_34.526946_g11277_i0.p2  ORF type:complete len:99 (+),score=0.16 NODE_12425_length_383_cov_34.526946_g11277_i0:29-298(+)
MGGGAVENMGDGAVENTLTTRTTTMPGTGKVRLGKHFETKNMPTQAHGCRAHRTPPAWIDPETEARPATSRRAEVSLLLRWTGHVPTQW